MTGYVVSFRSDDRCDGESDATVRLDVGTAGVQITDLVVRAGAGGVGVAALDLDVLARAFSGGIRRDARRGPAPVLHWPAARRSPRLRVIHGRGLDRS